MPAVGAWTRWYGLLGRNPTPQPYGNTATYQMGAGWLAPCALIEDWGCGKGWLRRFVSADRYRGVDGSPSPFADVVADLVTYRSSVPGVFLRHVLEHNYQWAEILDGALTSATERLCLILFTPLALSTQEIAYADDPGVPDISFRLDDLTDRIEVGGFEWTAETLETDTQYGTETVIRCWR